MTMAAINHRSQGAQLAAVGIAIAAGSFLLFESLHTYLPGPVQIAIEQSSSVAGWAVAAAVGLSMLFTGIGVLSVSSVRLLWSLRGADVTLVRKMAKDHLTSTAIVLAGFALSMAALYVLSQVPAPT